MAIFSLIVILTLGLYVNIGSMMAEITTTADQNFFRTYREIYNNDHIKWKTPSVNRIKCNTNGALISSNQRAACGGVFRDDTELDQAVLLVIWELVRFSWPNFGAFSQPSKLLGITVKDVV